MIFIRICLWRRVRLFILCLRLLILSNKNVALLFGGVLRLLLVVLVGLLFRKLGNAFRLILVLGLLNGGLFTVSLTILVGSLLFMLNLLIVLVLLVNVMLLYRLLFLIREMWCDKLVLLAVALAVLSLLRAKRRIFLLLCLD